MIEFGSIDAEAAFLPPQVVQVPSVSESWLSVVFIASLGNGERSARSYGARLVRAIVLGNLAVHKKSLYLNKI